MSLRFRKSIKIAPGVKMNISKKGVGYSAGTKGARMSVGADGKIRRTVGIPGTGIYDTETIGGKHSNASNADNIEDEPMLVYEKYSAFQIKLFSLFFLICSIFLFICGLLLLLVNIFLGLFGLLCAYFSFRAYRFYKNISKNYDNYKNNLM